MDVQRREVINTFKRLNMSQRIIALGHSLKLWWLDESLDDSCISGHYGQNHTGQKHQGQFVHIPAKSEDREYKYVSWCVCTRGSSCMHTYLLYTNKHYESHQNQAAGSVDTHIVEHCCSVVIVVEHFRCWNNVYLPMWRWQEARMNVLYS